MDDRNVVMEVNGYSLAVLTYESRGFTFSRYVVNTPNDMGKYVPELHVEGEDGDEHIEIGTVSYGSMDAESYAVLIDNATAAYEAAVAFNEEMLNNPLDD